MSPYRSLALLLLASGLALAGESKEPDVRAALAKLYAQATIEHDIWTALQCEAWGARNGVRLNPILGTSEIWGEPLFAFPCELRMVKDLDSRVLVATRYALHVLARDGRPLTVSLRHALVTDAETATFSTDGASMGVARGTNRGLVASPAAVLVRNTTTGEERWRITVSQLAERPGQRFFNLQAAVSCDGSAFVGAYGHTYASTHGLILAQASGSTDIPGMRAPRAVGPKGAWIIAELINRNATETDTTTGARVALRVGTTILPLVSRHAWAAGRDHAVVLIWPRTAVRAGIIAKAAVPAAPTPAPATAATTATTAAAETAGEAADPDAPSGIPVAVLVAPDGKLRQLPCAIALGPDASVNTVGDFLVVNAGAGADPLPEIDLLGMEVKPAGKQPPTHLLYAWETIARDAAQAMPMISGPGDAIFCPTLPAAYYCVRGNEVVQVDMGQNPPVETSLGTFGKRISSMVTTNNRLRITTEAENHVTDLDGKILWTGKLGRHPYLNGPAWMVVGEGPTTNRTFSAVNLLGTAESRREVPLTTRPNQTSTIIDMFGRFVITYDAERTTTLLNPADGQPFRTPLDPTTYRLREFWDFHGRFGMYGVGYSQGTRIYDKRQPWPDGAKGEWTTVQDALVIAGSGVLVLDDLSQVWVGRRGAPFQNLGTCPGAASILLADKDILFLNATRQVVGRFQPGKLVVLPTPIALPTVPLTVNRGTWQLDEDAQTFIPPRTGAACRWSEATRFDPVALRSTPGNTAPLTVVTRSLVLGIDSSTTTLRHCAQPLTTKPLR